LREKQVLTQRKVSTLVNGQVQETEVPITVRTFPIMFGIPMDEVMYSKFFSFFMRNVHPMPWDGVATTESTYLPDARNNVHYAFLKCKEYSHLMMIDSDVLMPAGAVEKLIAYDLPLVCGFYNSKHPLHPNHPVVYDFVPGTGDNDYAWLHRTEEGKGLEQVDGIGWGCCLMRRDVAEALGEKPYDMSHGTEDLVMCYKLRKLGVPIYLDWSINCAHVGVNWK
jgi:hypothetical protein